MVVTSLAHWILIKNYHQDLVVLTKAIRIL